MHNLYRNQGRTGVNSSDVQGRSWLYRAVESGSYAKVAELLKKGANIDLPDSRGATPLHAAIKNNDFKMVVLLLKHGACVDGARFPRVASPLMVAVNKSVNPEIFKVLLEQSPNLNMKDKEGRTVAHYWAETGDSYRFKLLAKAGVNFKTKTKKGAKSPTHVAVESGQVGNLECLRNYGLDLFSRDEDFRTPLHIAAAIGNLDILETLIESFLKRKNHESLATLEHGKTPLMVAAENGRYDVVNRLLDVGFNPNEKDHGGHTALHYAVKSENEEIVRQLVKRGADVRGFNINTRLSDDALHTAVETGHIGIISFLVLAGADLDKKNSIHMTPLMIAVSNMNADAVHALLSHGANPDTADMYGQRAIDYIAQRPKNKNSLEIARALVKAGADISMSPNYSMTRAPIHAAIASGNDELAELLLKQKGMLELKEYEDGFTPFLMAVAAGNKPLTEKILKMGANASARDKHGKNALHVALENGNLLLLKTLSKKLKLDVNEKDERGKNLFLRAISIGTSAAIQTVSKIKDIDKTAKDNDGNTALHIACDFDSRSIFDVVLTELDSVPLHDKNKHGNTALHVCAASGFSDGASIFLDMGAKIDEKNNYGATPLMLAVSSRSYTVTRILLEKGADVSVKYKNGGDSLAHFAVQKGKDTEPLLRILGKHGVSMQECDDDGNTPLHNAVQENNMDAIRILVDDMGVDLTLRNKAGKTPLHIAVDLESEHILSYFKEVLEDRMNNPNFESGKKGAGRTNDRKNKP